MKKVAINGFGRIGRMVFRKMATDNTLDLVAVNASYPPETLAHLVKHDTVQGLFEKEVSFDDNHIIVDGKKIRVTSDRNPENLPWRELGIDIVIESTGKFNTSELSVKHIKAGAKKVILTAPSKDETKMFVYGINEVEYVNEEHHIISNASCTTNALAPIVKVLEDEFGIENGLMTTVHAYTNDQNNLDNPHKDLRRARACAQSIIPTSTGAARAIFKVLPSLEGKLNGSALRVPTPTVSTVDLVVDVKRDATVEEINEAFKKASLGELKGVLGYDEKPLVSIDYVGDEHSTIVDGLSTLVIGKRKVKILSWYDNEWGYSCRVVDLAKYVAEKM